MSAAIAIPSPIADSVSAVRKGRNGERSRSTSRVRGYPVVTAPRLASPMNDQPQTATSPPATSRARSSAAGRQLWDEERTWEVPNPGEPGFDASKPKAYVLEMLPYPSGEPHVGHLKNYAIGDAIAHFRRRHGSQVIHPMGYDAFGLPAENHAIRTGEHPRDSTWASIEEFRRQFQDWGISIDWTREVATCEPTYYRWTQWLFLQLFERGLAYRTDAPVQWCPNDQTVLANEQVIDGHCERCGALVERRHLEQWYFRITDYADRLLDDFDDCSSPGPSTS